jgi:hypothetical protein
MSSGLYDAARQRFLRAGIDWEDDDIDVLLVTTAYTFDGTHEYVSDVVAQETGATDYVRVSVTGRTVSDATTSVADAADPTFAGIGDGVNENIGGAIFFKNSGTDYDGGTINADANRPLICYVDFTDFTTQDQDVTLVLPAGGLFDWAG